MSNLPVRVCEYYFSPVSPWAYLGHQRFIDLALQHGIKVEMKPLDIGQVFSASGGLPLAKRAPQRQAYRLQEMQRFSDFLGVPINVQPAFFPVPGELAGTLLIAAQLAHGTDRAMALGTAIMRALWAEQKNIADEATLQVVAEQADMDGVALLKSAALAGVISQYQQYTQQAIAANVFGVPWFVFAGQAYWGQDRLDFLERAFSGQAVS